MQINIIHTGNEPDSRFQDFINTLRHMKMCNMKSYYLYKYKEKTCQNEHGITIGTIQKINITVY